MRKDAIAELYSIAILLNQNSGQRMIGEWVYKYVHQCSARYYSDLIAAKQDKHFQSHIDEKLLFELTSKVIKDCSVDEKTETQTESIITKSVFVIGELNK